MATFGFNGGQSSTRLKIWYTIRHEAHHYRFEFAGKVPRKGAVYVDKTAQLHRLITSKTSDNYFIARPRRFGKSLMISTLEAIFAVGVNFSSETARITDFAAERLG